MIWRLVATILLSLWISTASAAPLLCAGIFTSGASTSSGTQVFQKNAQSPRMAYQVSGDTSAETVIVFLNGIDKSSREWDQVRDIMIAKKTPASYIQLDLLGQGQTAQLSPTTHIPYEQQVQLLKDFLDSRSLHGKKLVLIGHSYGGGIAARFVHDHPGIAHSVVLVNPFVDNLESYQPVIGPMMAWARHYAAMTGASAVYESHIQISADLGAISSWPMYAYSGRADAELSNVLALTHGIRYLGMTESVSAPGNTIIHLVISSWDEMIPEAAHDDLFDHIPANNRGVYLVMPVSHESVVNSPQQVVKAIDQALEF